MRRHAEIAHYAIHGAWNALLAAQDAAREALAVARALTIDANDARAVYTAALHHLHRVEAAVAILHTALDSAEAVDQAVDRAEISRFGIPVLQAQAGA